MWRRAHRVDVQDSARCVQLSVCKRIIDLLPAEKLMSDRGKSMSDDTDRITKLQSRATLFNLLAQSFNYPDMDLIESLCRGDFTATLHNIAEHLNIAGTIAEEITELEKLYVGSDQAQEALLLELEKDYTRMFFSSKPRLVYLFESVYKEGKLLQDSTFEIARLYYDAGLNMVDDFKLPPDHIAVEFEFMAYLYFNEREAVQKSNRENEDLAQKLQKDVLEKHLTTFGRALAEKVRMHARTKFYKCMAKVVTLMLTGER